MRRLLLLCALFSPFSFGAIVAPLPFTISSGQVISANPLQQNFSWLMNQVNANGAPLVGPSFTGVLTAQSIVTSGAVTVGGALGVTGASAFTLTPTAPTAATADNSTSLATTAYTINRIANDAPTKTGTGASGNWAINVTGQANTAITATTATNATNAVTSTTSAAGTNTTAIATTAFANAAHPGYGSYVDYSSAGRALDTLYTNSSAVPRLVLATVELNAATLDVQINAVNTLRALSNSTTVDFPITFTVPPGQTYKLVTSGGGSKVLARWLEN